MKLTKAALIEKIERLKGDEREIVETLIDYLDKGREKFGPWDVTDGRNYLKEAEEEIWDGLLWAGAAIVKRRKK